MPIFRFMPDTFTLCEQWLHDALTAFKQSALLTRHQAEGHAEKLQRQLLNAACAGQQALCHRLIVAFQNKHPAAQHPLMSIVLPVIYQIEQDWREDRRDYSTTLFAFWNLQQVLQQNIDSPPAHRSAMTSHSAQVLIAPAPDCEHNLGIYAVADFFRTQGWPTQMLVDARPQVLLERISRQHVDFLGLSVGHDAGLDGLADFLQECRKRSAHPKMRILLGGNIFTLRKSSYAWLGADLVALDPAEAHAFCQTHTSTKPH